MESEKRQGHAEAGSLPVMSVIIAARNEENYIGGCLEAVLAQDDAAGPVEVILAANACTDKTAEVASAFAGPFAERHWPLKILDVPEPGKPNALNAGDVEAGGAFLVFLDADVRIEPDLLGQLRRVLDTEKALYATGVLVVAPAKTWVTGCYARLWVNLPFIQSGAVGAGLFAVNRAGRQRWGAFPNIISDDTFVRLQFNPEERVEVRARYQWPMVEGFANLVKVRKRQDAGVAEIARLYPDLPGREGKAEVTKGGLVKLLLKMPVAFFIYALVHLAVRLRPLGGEWTRGR